MLLLTLVPTIGMMTDRVLMQLDHLLEDDVLLEAVKADLARRYPRTLSTVGHLPLSE